MTPSHESWWFSCGFRLAYLQCIWDSVLLPSSKCFHNLLCMQHPWLLQQWVLATFLILSSFIGHQCYENSFGTLGGLVFGGLLGPVSNWRHFTECYAASQTFSRISTNTVVDHCVAWHYMFNFRFDDAWKGFCSLSTCGVRHRLESLLSVTCH